jgi:hypothetical protein
MTKKLQKRIRKWNDVRVVKVKKIQKCWRSKGHKVIVAKLKSRKMKSMVSYDYNINIYWISLGSNMIKNVSM